MHVEQVQFDEVVDAAASRGDFSFRSAGRAWYGIHFPGKPIPRDGATFAVAFAERGNWASVLGWRNLARPAVTLTHPTASFLLSLSFELILYGPFFVIGALVFGGSTVAATVAALIAGISLWRTARVMRRNRAVERALLGVASGSERLHAPG